jgi:hypothetical protein
VGLRQRDKLVGVIETPRRARVSGTKRLPVGYQPTPASQTRAGPDAGQRRQDDGLLLPASSAARRGARPLRRAPVPAPSAWNVRHGLEAVPPRRQGVHADSHHPSRPPGENLAAQSRPGCRRRARGPCSSCSRPATPSSPTEHSGHCPAAKAQGERMLDRRVAPGVVPQWQWTSSGPRRRWSALAHQASPKAQAASERARPAVRSRTWLASAPAAAADGLVSETA